MGRFAIFEIIKGRKSKGLTMKHALITVPAIFLLLSAPFASAEVGFRCGTHLIDVGDRQEDVLKHCGEPTSQSGWTWIYDRGPSEFDIIVHFEADGTVNRIQNADEKR
jgi:hypothetical protein